MSVSSSRMALKPYTFSNGITVASGTFLAVPIWPIHMNENVYHKPHEFDGFRFSRLQEKDNEKKGLKAFSTSFDYLTFGHGLHSWYLPSLQKNDTSPGRFLAVSQLKLMLAFVLLRFDIKTRDGIRPSDTRFQQICVPDRKAEILYRKRLS